ncbi:hypothetical protein L6452_02715 [Arctium lappa]|uniref:Uncharacterized protein n=1 Tax=Arctium lappa TaxID=4217 RepID=A0ACB9FL67_ARCLA|nr:hypothetical protein L6452_02715 [Arctium lappa]
MKEARIAALSIVCKKKVMWELDQGEETRADDEILSCKNKIKHIRLFNNLLNTMEYKTLQVMKATDEVRKKKKTNRSSRRSLIVNKLSSEHICTDLPFCIGKPCKKQVKFKPIWKGVESEQTSRKKPMEFSLVAAIAGNQGRRATVVVGVQDHQGKKKGHCRRGEHRCSGPDSTYSADASLCSCVGAITPFPIDHGTNQIDTEILSHEMDD